MQLAIKKLRFQKILMAIGINLAISMSVFASDSVGYFEQDLNSLSGLSIRPDEVFDLGAWGLDSSSGMKLSERLRLSAGHFITPVAHVIDVCKEPSDGAIADQRNPPIGSLCSSSLIDEPLKLKVFEVSGDPSGYFNLVSVTKDLFPGGFVLSKTSYAPFTMMNWQIYRYTFQSRPEALLSEQSFFAFRVANYIGDLLSASDSKREAIHICQGVVSSMDFMCDDDFRGVFSLKGVALIALAKSCNSCSHQERAYLAGSGILYLVSTPSSGPWNLLGRSYYISVSDSLRAAGYDTGPIEKILLRNLTK